MSSKAFHPDDAQALEPADASARHQSGKLEEQLALADLAARQTGAPSRLARTLQAAVVALLLLGLLPLLL